MSELNVIQEQSGICRRLRTKNSFGSCIGHATFWEDGDSTTAVYWCLDTMGSAGPSAFMPLRRLDPYSSQLSIAKILRPVVLRLPKPLQSKTLPGAARERSFVILFFLLAD